MKQFLDFLRKIGLLHVSKGDYRSGEYDTREDLKNDGEDKNRSSAAVAGASAGATAGGVSDASSFQTLLKSSLIFRAVMIIAVVILLIFLMSTGFTFWFLVAVVMWIWFIMHIKKGILTKTLVMKKTIYLLLVFVVATFIFIAMGDSSTSTKNDFGSSGSSQDDDRSYEVTQVNFSSSIFARDLTGKNKKSEHLEMYISPLITLNQQMSDATLEKFEIRDLKLSKKPKVGEVKRVAPKHLDASETCLGFYFEGCDNALAPQDVGDDGASIKYEVVEGDIEFLDQVSSDRPILPKFKIVVSDIGTFDYDAIMKRDKMVDGSRVAQYAGLKASDLASTIEFEIYMEFDTGEDVTYHISADMPGETAIRGGTVTGIVK